ncbi:MAG: BatA domain-containing protein, partial [Muribaculaceae bacterium]|nr:BatA domain-containing protein [Muribaculaceae bacterium]
MTFLHPGLLWLLLILVPLIVWYVLKQHNANPSIGIS